MTFNADQGQGSRVRTPLIEVYANKLMLDGVIEAEVVETGNFTPNSFRITAAISGLPHALNAAYWSDSVGDLIEIFMGIDGDRKRVMYGNVDDVEIDIVERTLVLTGRDFAAKFIDAKTTQKFQEQRASDIAVTLAASHGMKAVVVKTDTLSGTYYELNHSRLLSQQSEWDLLKFLAEQEGYDLWIDGDTLHFEPPVASDAEPYVLLWSDQGEGDRLSNFEHIRLRRNQTLAKDVVVKVRSWNQAQEKAFTVTYRSSQKRARGPGSDTPQTYSFVAPNLSREQALQYAKTKATEITRHERTLEVGLPGDNKLTTRRLVKLVGTATSWDQNYYPDTITRAVSREHGYEIEMRAKNHSPRNVALI